MKVKRLLFLVDSSSHPLLERWIRNNRWRWQRMARDFLEAELSAGHLPEKLTSRKTGWMPSPQSIETQTSSVGRPVEKVVSDVAQPLTEDELRERREAARRAMMRNPF